MKTVAVIFGLIFLVYLAAWLGSLDMAARIAALLLIAEKAVGLGALVVLCWKVKKQWDRMEDIICIMCWTMSLSYQLQFLTHRQENMNFMDMSMIKRETDSGKDRGMNHSLIREY